jgi:hypothetical protein
MRNSVSIPHPQGQMSSEFIRGGDKMFYKLMVTVYVKHCPKVNQQCSINELSNCSQEPFWVKFCLFFMKLVLCFYLYNLCRHLLH